MRCCLWDLLDEGVDDVLDSLKGEANISAISIPLVCPPVDALRVHKGVSPRTFRSRGGAQFQPQAEHYAGTRLRPVVAEWLRRKDPLPHVIEAAIKRGLGVRGEIVCSDAPTIADKYPHAACKNVYGDPSPSRLCPANPDVQEYLRALVANLQQGYALAEIEISGLDWRGPKFAADTPLDTSPTRPALARRAIAYLGAICFCESCRQQADRAGLNVTRIAQEVEATLDRLLSSGEAAEDVDGIRAQIDGLAAYEAYQHKLLLHLRLPTPVVATAIAPAPAGTNPATPLTGQILVPPGAAAIEPDWLVDVTLDGPLADAADLVRWVSELVTASPRGVTFAHYGAMPRARLAWVKQAIRKAQRDTA